MSSALYQAGFLEITFTDIIRDLVCYIFCLGMLNQMLGELW